MSKMNVNKIDSSNSIRVDRHNDVRGMEKEGAVTRKKSVATGEDEVKFSDRASEVGSLVEQLKQMPDVRDEKVNALREKIAAGEFNPTDSEIAKAIIRDED